MTRMVCATVFYSGHSIDNLFFNLNFLEFSCIVSPLHDRDTRFDGEYKEPHYHVLIDFGDSVTQDHAREVISSLDCVGCDVVRSVRSYVRYMCHLDNPDKAQYPPEDMCFHGGFSYDSFFNRVK